MGNIVSSAPTREGNAERVRSESETMNNANVFSDDDKNENADNANKDEARVKAKEEEMIEFHKQLTLKREQRREILTRHRAEKEELERSLQIEKAAKVEISERNKQLCEILIKNNIAIPDDLKCDHENTELSQTLIQMNEDFILIKSNNTKLRKELAEANNALQSAYSDIADLNVQNTESFKQIRALKDVVSVSKTMIGLREEQLNELKSKLNEIERNLADRETNLLSADLRQEYERQLLNIRTLRGLYEERARLAEVTRQGLVRELDEHKVLYQAEVKKCKDLSEKVEELDNKIDTLIETIDSKNSQISSCQEETNVLKAEMTVVNKLFSQVLLGYKTKQDLDTLVHRLEENHGILTHMAERENGSEISSELPKLLLELVSQVDENEDRQIKEGFTTPDEVTPDLEVVADQDSVSFTETQKSAASAEDIVENLPKVWKVLIELLSHQNATEEESSAKVTTCYKSVETPSGPVLVPSVSQTYIRLKDLILEKLGLIKEVNRMKQLNSHLETRLGEQERRLCLVTSELSKTWHVVGRLRRHHHQLHTHEKILKYELQQKRKLLNELKEELEYCREKWEQAREKNTQSERDWKTLRAEFSSRKIKAGSPSFNNSAESGYSDERPSDESSESNDESEYVAEPQVRSKKKVKKPFEAILDSSTDFNLAAEREDPVSDMLDVADLPLDTQESEEHHDCITEPSKSDVLLNDKICEETEDEVADITHDDSCPEDPNSEDILNDQTTSTTDVTTLEIIKSSIVISPGEPSSSGPLIDPAEILRNVKLQDERLAAKDERLRLLESNSAALLKKTQTNVEIGEQLNSTLDHLIHRPNTSSSNETEHVSTEKKNTAMDKATSSDKTITDNAENSNKQQDCSLDNEPTNAQSAETSTPDFKAILESVRKQNERLAKKDERLQKMEASCSEVVENIASNLSSGNKLIEKLDILHSHCQGPSDANEATVEEDNSKEDSSSSDKEDSGPSTSSEIDHEARFAARDLRLKRLEEQTKSLVNKVNKTTSKGVKINYKLDELQNIYGSENSRAGTPSEENEDKNNGNELPEE